MIHKFEFGSEAIPFIESCLFKGKTLAKLVLKKYRIEQRKEIFAYLPISTTFEQRVKFLEGGIINKDDAYEIIAQKIKDYVLENEKNCVVFEHPLASPGDTWLKKVGLKYLYHLQDVYLFVDHHNADINHILKVLRNIGSYYAFGAFTKSSTNYLSNLAKDTINYQELTELVERIKYIALGVYDEETMIFWERD